MTETTIETISEKPSYVPVQIMSAEKAKQKALEKIEKKLLNYLKKAIHDYDLIQKNDKIMVCLTGGKDSFSLLFLLHKLNKLTGNKFSVFSYTLDQSQPGWDDSKLRHYLESHGRVRHVGSHRVLPRTRNSFLGPLFRIEG